MRHVTKVLFSPIYYSPSTSSALQPPRSRRRESSFLILRVLRLIVAPIDHNERIVTWINSPRGLREYFLVLAGLPREKEEKPGEREGERERKKNVYNNSKANEASERREYFRWRGVFIQE